MLLIVTVPEIPIVFALPVNGMPSVPKRMESLVPVVTEFVALVPATTALCPDAKVCVLKNVLVPHVPVELPSPGVVPSVSQQ